MQIMYFGCIACQCIEMRDAQGFGEVVPINQIMKEGSPMCEIKNKKPTTMSIKVGNNTYLVGINFKQDAKETLADKLNRLIKRDVLEGSYAEN